MKIKLLIFLIIIFSISTIMGKDIVLYISESLNCSIPEAESFLSYLDNSVLDIQEQLTNIALKRVKNSDIEVFIEKYFYSENSIIQVSSLNHDKIKQFIIIDYLRSLTNLSSITYSKIELYFEQDYLSLGSIETYIDSELGEAHEFQVSMWQVFRGYLDGCLLYEDYTRKAFTFLFYKEDNNWFLKIKCITVEQTENREDFQEIKKRWIPEND